MLPKLCGATQWVLREASLLAGAWYESEPHKNALNSAHVRWVFSEVLEVADVCLPGMRSFDAPLRLAGCGAREIALWALPTNREAGEYESFTYSLG